MVITTARWFSLTGSAPNILIMTANFARNRSGEASAHLRDGNACVRPNHAQPTERPRNGAGMCSRVRGIKIRMWERRRPSGMKPR